MDLKAQYLQAVREQAPSLFKRLSKSGQLEEEARLASVEANRMFRELTKDGPKGGYCRSRTPNPSGCGFLLADVHKPDRVVRADRPKVLR